MAVNPRAESDNASKGSRYIPERLVGPGIIEQNSYIDKAKAKLHIGNITPVPSVNGGTGEITATSHNFPTLALGGVDIGPGDLIRIIATATASALIFNNSSGGEVSGTAAVHIRGGSEILVVIPPGATGYTLGVAITAIEFTKDD